MEVVRFRFDVVVESGKVARVRVRVRVPWIDEIVVVLLGWEKEEGLN